MSYWYTREAWEKEMRQHIAAGTILRKHFDDRVGLYRMECICCGSYQREDGTTYPEVKHAISCLINEVPK